MVDLSHMVVLFSLSRNGLNMGIICHSGQWDVRVSWDSSENYFTHLVKRWHVEEMELLLLKHKGSRLSWLVDKTLKLTWITEHQGEVLEGPVELRFCCCFQMHPKQHIPKLFHTFNNPKPSCAMPLSFPLLQTSPSLPRVISFYPNSDFPPSSLISQLLLETPYLLFSPGWRKMLWILTLRNFAYLHIYTFFFFIAPRDYANIFGWLGCSSENKGLPK